MGTCGRPFDPRKTVTLEVKSLRRAVFWDDVKLYLKVLAYLAIPTALVIWLICEKL